MTEDQFWNIIEASKEKGKLLGSPSKLKIFLEHVTDEELVDFDAWMRHFRNRMAKSFGDYCCDSYTDFLYGIVSAGLLEYKAMLENPPCTEDDRERAWYKYGNESYGYVIHQTWENRCDWDTAMEKSKLSAKRVLELAEESSVAPV